MNTPEKKCSKCGEVKSFDEFSKDKSRKDGLERICKCCRKEYNTRYYIDNADKINEYRKQYYKQYYIDNADKINESHKKYYIDNGDKINKSHKRYRDSNLDKFAAYSSKRRALKQNQTHPDHNPIIEQCLHQQRIALSMIGNDCEVDHIWPISRGGPHHHMNLQLIPSELNKAKLANMSFKHPLLKHWTDIPIHLLKWIKANNPEQFKSAVKEWVKSGQYTIGDFKEHLRQK